jgi:hypothetical protein
VSTGDEYAIVVLVGEGCDAEEVDGDFVVAVAVVAVAAAAGD